jgi:hypothetical protein
LFPRILGIKALRADRERELTMAESTEDERKYEGGAQMGFDPD